MMMKVLRYVGLFILVIIALVAALEIRLFQAEEGA